MTHQPPSSRTRRAAISILSGVLVGSASIWGVQPAGAEPSPSKPPDPVNATVRYELTGTGVAGYITYATDRGQLHAVNVPLPWSMQVTRMHEAEGAAASSLVSGQGVGPGSITCVIKVDGKVVSQNTATGDPARVMCENHDSRFAPTTTTTAPDQPGT